MYAGSKISIKEPFHHQELFHQGPFHQGPFHQRTFHHQELFHQGSLHHQGSFSTDPASVDLSSNRPTN